MRAAGIWAACMAASLSACASGEDPRPPQGVDRGGTDFGYWNRDAEGAVDAAFRSFITRRYGASDAARAQADLTVDGFDCRDGNRPDGRPVPELECVRLHEAGDYVHAWAVEFWPGDRAPRARYTRTRTRSPITAKDDAPSRGR